MYWRGTLIAIEFWPCPCARSQLFKEMRKGLVRKVTGADPETFHGAWLSGWLLFNYTEPWGWLASNDRPTPIVLCTNEQVYGGG